MAHISNGDLEDAPSLGQGREEASVRARIHSRTAALSYLSGPNSDLTRRCSQARSSSGAPCLWRDRGRLAGKAPWEIEHAGSIEVWGFAARQHGNPSPVFAHQEKLEATRALECCLLCHKMGLVVPAFQGCSELI